MGRRERLSERETIPLEQSVLKYIESELSSDLIAHLISTRDFALEINHDQKLGLDDEKIAVAALCHDIARLLPVDEIINKLKSYGIEPDSLNAATPILLHGPLSAVIAREELGVEDGDILRSIWIHATGAGGMSLFEKLIYIADKVEPTRTFEGVEELRRLVREDLDSAFIHVISAVLAWLVARGQPLDYNSIAAYNCALGESEEPPESM